MRFKSKPGIPQYAPISFTICNIPSRYLNSGYPGNRGIFPKAAHARTINAMMHFLGFPERVVADDRRHKYEASGCGSHT